MNKIVLKVVWLILSCPFAIFGQTPQQLPEGTRENYVDYRDASISDEFNEKSLDFTKWGRRNTGGYMVINHYRDSSLVVMESRKLTNGKTLSYVSLKGVGDGADSKASAIVSRASGFYGFYVVRFRYRGFDNQKTRSYGNIWHPAVWSGITDHIDIPGENRRTTSSKYWTEIDFMEWEGKVWSSDAPARLLDSKGVSRKVITRGDDSEKAIMRKRVGVLDSIWQTIGLEYSPKHLKIWEWKDGQWSHMGERVVHFVEDDLEVPESKYTINSIGKKARQPCFWLLSNVVSGYLYDDIENGTTNKAMNDVSIDFDFFRYYRHLQAIDIDWAWENERPKGGGQIQKDTSYIEPIVDSSEEIDFSQSLVNYPNPTSDLFIMNFEDDLSKEISIYVFDLQGRIVLQNPVDAKIENRSIIIDVSVLPTGSYVLQVLHKGKNYISKFVKK